MQVRTTEDLRNYLIQKYTKEVVQKEYSDFVIEDNKGWIRVGWSSLHPVCISLDEYGNAFNVFSKFKYEWYGNSCDGYFNIYTHEIRGNYETCGYGHYGYKTRKMKDRKSGICDALRVDAVYFTTNEEAEDYVTNYAKSHPEQIQKHLEKAIRKTKKELRKLNKRLKMQEAAYESHI